MSKEKQSDIAVSRIIVLEEELLTLKEKFRVHHKAMKEIETAVIAKTGAIEELKLLFSEEEIK